MIRDIEKLTYKINKRRIPKHEPTDSLFYLERKLEKCMMRDDALNFHIYSVRIEMTNTKQVSISHVCSTDESKLKQFLVDKTFFQVYSTDKEESKGIIVDERSTYKDE